MQIRIYGIMRTMKMNFDYRDFSVEGSVYFEMNLWFNVLCQINRQVATGKINQTNGSSNDIIDEIMSFDTWRLKSSQILQFTLAFDAW